MKEKRKVEVEEITCDICRMEVPKDEKGQIRTIPLKQSIEKEIDVCWMCYHDLEDYFRDKFKEGEG